MNTALAHDEIRIAAKWWRDLLVRLHNTGRPADLFSLLPEHAPIRDDRADLFETALVTEIEATFEMDLVTWDPACPASGASRRILSVMGQRAPSEVVRAADFAGLSHALRHLPDGASTTINPGRVMAYVGRKGRDAARVETLEVPALARGGASS